MTINNSNDTASAERRTLLTELSRVLSDKTDSAVHERIGLRDAVCAYVVAEGARGTPLSTVIRTVKETLRKAEESAGKASDELAQMLIDWCKKFHRTVALGSA